MRKAQKSRIEDREEAGTARIVRKTKAAVAAGREVLLPKAVVNRLAAGEKPQPALREWLDKARRR
ncbi:MAG TPA: hypothetical protein VGI22_28145 [Xanthobacteraceae bacterium]|jgi:hypothetical protein